MQNNEYQGTKPRILVLGASGRTGWAVVDALEKQPEAVEVVLASRRHDQVEAWKREGRHAVYLDLDDARTFPEALAGIDRLYLMTGYTVEMVHQSKTIVDAAAESGVSFIVHLGVFGNGKSTDPHFAWHEMIERYIEGSGIAWCHVHPHFFMENLLTRYPLLNERLVWFMGEKRMGWIANDDLAGVAAKVLAEGPARHAGQNYWLSTEAMNGVETAKALTQGLGRDIACDVKTPDDLIALLASHALELPAASTTEATYAASTLEWMRQTYDGRMDYSAVATTTVQDLLGRPPLGLRAWAELHRNAVLAASIATV
jgi:uncharacterized protein YbjT (DUF2867 family)